MSRFHKIVPWVLLFAFVPMSCSDRATESQPADVPDRVASATELAANCLSFPVIWSDGAAKSLRGTFGENRFDGMNEDRDDPATPEIDLMPWFYQADLYNEWQAESRDQLAYGPLEISRVDWGDNLESRSWTSNSVVRVETVLLRDLAGPEQMLGFRMLKLNDAMGRTEIWGTNTHTYLSSEATVYSGCARLTIQKLSRLRDDPALSLTWNALTGQWDGDVAATVFNSGVWQAADGPGYYAAEINVQGKCIYGYNWFVSRIRNAAGDYRITFSLQDAPGAPMLNTFVTPATSIAVPVEEPADGAVVTAEPDQGGGVAMLRPDLNLTYIDVRITAVSSGGSGSRR